MMMTEISLSKKIKNDKQYLRAMRSLDALKEDLDSKSIIAELFSLQASRGVSALRPNKILQSAQHVLIDSSVQEIAVRSRTTTIKMSALRSLLTIEQVTDPLRKYIMYQYGGDLKADGYTTVAAQKSALDNLLKVFIKEVRDLEYILKIADLVLEDVDAAGWNLSRIEKVIESSRKDR
jgi:hypothetical protein